MTSFSGQHSQAPGGVDLRRSSRLEQAVPLLVLGTTRNGESFQETTSALSVNLHGCRYSSRHEYPLEGWITLQVTGTDGRSGRPVRARVRSVLSPRTPRELCQVGVELETPENIWGISSPPEDWTRLLGITANATNGDEWRRVLAPNAAAPAVTAMPNPAEPPAGLSSVLEKHLAPTDKKAEVTMFPGPVAPAEPPSAAGISTPGKSQRIVLTTEQLVQALQSRLQQAADRVVKTAVATQLDEAVRNALAKIDDVWKSNVRQTEEFSTSRLAEAQNRWERELVVYRGRAEDVARRLEALSAATKQNLAESQKLLERLTTEVEPQLHARLDQSFTQAHTQFEAKAAEISERTLTKWSEGANLAALDARAKLDDSLAEARALRSNGAAAQGIPEQQVRTIVNAAREQTLNRQDERLAEIWRQFEQQQDQTRKRTDEIAQQIQALTNELRDTKAQQENALAEIRSLASSSHDGGLSQQQLDSALDAAKNQFHDLLEWRLGEVSAQFQHLHDASEQHSGELKQHLEALASQTRGAQEQHDQHLTDLRSQIANLPAAVTQERIDWLLNSAREQILNHIEWRVGEASAEFEEQHDSARRRSDELAQNFEKFATETRARLDEIKALAEQASREPAKQDVAGAEHSIERVSRDFETAAARITDRQLIHLMEQKQALTSEAALELEARASETRAALQKAANATLEDVRRRVEVQIDLITAEATQRITSALGAIEAENRAACEVRRRSLESDVARAAEQSTMEFRSGIRAFLYSCLVAAVGAVDQHAQTTLAGLSKDPNAPPVNLSIPEFPAPSPSPQPQPEERSSAATASSSPSSTT